MGYKPNITDHSNALSAINGSVKCNNQPALIEAIKTLNEVIKAFEFGVEANIKEQDFRQALYRVKRDNSR